jgi:hypothetical protein
MKTPNFSMHLQIAERDSFSLSEERVNLMYQKHREYKNCYFIIIVFRFANSIREHNSTFEFQRELAKCICREVDQRRDQH